ncbi:MAG: hypothetical protein CEE42_00045 [Promethearchaeota archaeon Loki_b31]|nr:MAG: hypothetical protein CEE42_00045 [Candidatus Lokiarchaeota archaeon Loki_b31]
MRKKKLKVLVLILFLLLPIEIITSSYTNKFPFLLVQSDEEIAKTEIKMSLNSFGIDWLPDGTPISTANNSQRNPQICSDGAGGAIITWQDYRSGSNYDIYAQRIDSSGNLQWTADGVVICTASDSQYRPEICSDGAGGAIITWYDYRSGLYSDIYAQRVNHLGNIQWTINGTAICTAGESQLESQLCSNGAGGAIITWIDYRSGSNYDIYVQEVSSSGGIEWNINGTAICTVNNDQINPQIFSDGSGGAIITWKGAGIYAQRIDSSGNLKWTVNGTAICTANGDKRIPQLCSNGAGGAIITWFDYRSGSNYDIYVQEVSSSGGIEWNINGTAICTANGDQYAPQLCSDGSGGAIITWYDGRSGSTGRNIYSQSINSSGNIQWTNNGVAICTANNDQWVPQLCSDGSGGAIISWYDNRNIDITGRDIYVQLINSAGNVLWISNGLAICTVNNDQINPQICSDGAGGAIITWNDGRSENDDIYAQHIKSPELEGGEIPFVIIVAIVSFIGIAVLIGIATTLIIKKRRKIE